MIECTKFHSVLKGSLQGFASLYVEKWGVDINSITLYMKDGKRWINLPSREYEEDGVKKYSPIIFFKDKRILEEFNKQALKAIDAFCVANPR